MTINTDIDIVITSFFRSVVVLGACGTFIITIIIIIIIITIIIIVIIIIIIVIILIIIIIILSWRRVITMVVFIHNGLTLASR